MQKNFTNVLKTSVMTLEELNFNAKGVAVQLMADLKDKLCALARRESCTPQEIATKYSISPSDYDSIMRGVSSVTVKTFIKILILSGHTIEVKSLKEQLQHGVIPPPMPPRPEFTPRFPAGGYHHAPRPGQQMEAPTRPTRPKTSPACDWHEFDEDGAMEDYEDIHGDHMEPINFDDMPEPAAPTTPPFRTMSRQELVDIIEDKLWSSEIDVEDVTKEQLIEFLEEKDKLHKRIASRKSRRQSVSAEAMEALKNNLEEAVKRNPHLKEDVERLIDIE